MLRTLGHRPLLIPHTFKSLRTSLQLRRVLDLPPISDFSRVHYLLNFLRNSVLDLLGDFLHLLGVCAPPALGDTAIGPLLGRTLHVFLVLGHNELVVFGFPLVFLDGGYKGSFALKASVLKTFKLPFAGLERGYVFGVDDRGVLLVFFLILFNNRQVLLLFRDVLLSNITAYRCFF